jgi:hypothetical protein
MSRSVSQFGRPVAPEDDNPPAANSRLSLDARSSNSRGVGGEGGVGDLRARHGSPAVTRFVITLLLTIHAGLLAWQAYRYSPTIDEPAHLAAGISHWKFGRFDLYRVNPPLVRMIAALPMLLVEPKVDWSAFTEAAYARPEFAIGSALANGNGFDIFWDFTLGRRWSNHCPAYDGCHRFFRD